MELNLPTAVALQMSEVPDSEFEVETELVLLGDGFLAPEARRTDRLSWEWSSTGGETSSLGAGPDVKCARGVRRW